MCVVYVKVIKSYEHHLMLADWLPACLLFMYSSSSITSSHDDDDNDNGVIGVAAAAVMVRSTQKRQQRERRGGKICDKFAPKHFTFSTTVRHCST